MAPGAAAIAQESANLRSLITLDHASTLSNASLYPAPYPEGGMSASNTVRTGNWVNFNSATNTYTPVMGVMDDRYGAYQIPRLRGLLALLRRDGAHTVSRLGPAADG